MKKISKVILFILILFIPLEFMAQSRQQIKVSEFGVSHITSIEERVFIVHAILDKGYYCYKNEDLPNTLDVYMPSDASDELSDFDFFFDNVLYDQLNEFRNLDKNQRGVLFVQWRRMIDPEIYKVIHEDFTKGARTVNNNGTRTANSICDGALPFCTDNGIYEFPAGVNADPICTSVYTYWNYWGTAQITANEICEEPYYCGNQPIIPRPTYNQLDPNNCLVRAPNPAFYFMQVSQHGDLHIQISTQPENDIDFECWGPFDDIETACDQLSCNNIVDCGFSTATTEICQINNAQPGQIYVLLITNYSNEACNIQFENVGGGATDCSLLPPLADNNGPYCVGETIQLSALSEEYGGASYLWSGPNNYTSRYRNPSISNCTMEMAGTYTCTITNNGRTASATTEVIIYPKPDASFTASAITVCLDDTLQFDASSSTMNPPQYNIASYEWIFSDGQTESGVTISHVFTQAGPNQVTLHLTSEDGHCTDELTLNVSVNDPNAEDYYETICEGESITFNGNSYSQEGDYPITIQTEGCESTATLHLSVIDLDVEIEVSDNEICEGDTVMLHASSSYELVAVGDILCTDGIIVKPAHWPCGKTAKGIVFYVDDSHLHGYAVDLHNCTDPNNNGHQYMKWSTQSVLKIASYSHWRDAIKDFNGYNNTQILRTGTSAATYPAAWAVDFANGWYLPSAGQVNLLYGELMDVNASLTLVGGTRIEDLTGTYGINNGDVFLWSSTEWNASQAMCIKIMDGLVKSVNKTTGDKYYVRSVINF